MTQLVLAGAESTVTPSLTFGFYCEPFGAEIVHTDHDQSMYLSHLYQTAIGKLLVSTDPNDITTVKGINARFVADKDSKLTDNKANAYPEGILAWLAGASSKDFVLFCTSNAMHYEQHQKSMEAALPELQETTATMLGNVVELGLLPTKGLTSISRIYDKVTVKPMDSFDAGGKGYNALYMHGNKPMVAMSNLFKDRPNMRGVSPEFRRSMFHEYLHALGAINRAGFYLGYSVPANKTTANFSWLEEAFVTHLVQVANARVAQADIVNPSERIDETSLGYVDERTFLGLLLTAGSSTLTVAEIGEAFMIERGSNSRIRKTVLRKLARNYRSIYGGHDAYGLIRFSEEYGLTKNDAVNRRQFLKQTIRHMYANITGSLASDDIDLLTMQPAQLAAANLQ